MPVLLVAMGVAVFLTAHSLWRFRNQQLGTERAFHQTDREFASVFQSVLDGILIVDDRGDCLDANPAAAAILRLPTCALIGENISRFLTASTAFTRGWKSFLRHRKHCGRTRLIAGDNSTVFVSFVATAHYLPGRHLLIICDVTESTQAEISLRNSEVRFQAAKAEAEALRKSTLALSQNLAMDSVLDVLLLCISDLVPFDNATVLFVDDGFELMVAREAPRNVSKRIGLSLKASENVFLQRVLFEKRAILLCDVNAEQEWRNSQPFDRLQSWLGIPLVAAGRVLGILSMGSDIPCIFTTEHLRLAKSLAIPAAVAIQNARNHQRAEIYAAELETRLKELRDAQSVLERVDRRTPRPC